MKISFNKPCVVKNFIKEDFIEDLRKELFSYFDISDENWENAEKGLVRYKLNNPEMYLLKMRAFSKSIFVQNIFSKENILQLAKMAGIEHPTLFSQPVLHIACNDLIENPENRGVAIHQDWPSLQGSYNSVVIWAAIYGTENEDGGLYFAVPKDNAPRLLTSKPIGAVCEISDPEVIGYDQKYVGPSPGDVVIFNQFLPHYSKPISKLRMSISIRIEDAKDNSWVKRGYSFAQKKMIDRLDVTETLKTEVNHDIRKSVLDI